MKYLNEIKEELNENIKPDYNSKGFKEASDLVNKLRSSTFKKLSDYDLEQFRIVIADALDLKID